MKYQHYLRTTICYVISGKNVQPYPVHFLYVNKINLNYTYPPNCSASGRDDGTWQNCSSVNDKWTMWEWLFTNKPNCFGLISGLANLTGILLYLALLLIVFASLPFVRRSGKFEVNMFCFLFYKTFKE